MHAWQTDIKQEMQGRKRFSLLSSNEAASAAVVTTPASLCLLLLRLAPEPQEQPTERTN